MPRIFKNIDLEARLKPSEKSWLKLERKLDRHRYKKGINNYRNIAIAAIGLFLISFTILMTFYLEDKSVDNKSLTESFFAYQLEDLNKSQDQHFTYTHIKILSEKYKEAGFNQK